MAVSLISKRGFTVAESVIAIAVCALVLAGAYPLLTMTTSKLYQARDHYAATSLCLAQIERAKNVPYGQLGNVFTNEDKVRVNEAGELDPSGRFRRTIAVIPNSMADGVTEVKVTAEIMDRRTGDFSSSLSFTTNSQETVSYLFTEYLSPIELPGT